MSRIVQDLPEAKGFDAHLLQQGLPFRRQKQIEFRLTAAGEVVTVEVFSGVFDARMDHDY